LTNTTLSWYTYICKRGGVMHNGKWYLVYTSKNWMENVHDIETTEILLKATTEKEAVAEARTKWAGIVSEANARWEQQKATWVHPPSTVFDDVPPNPHVVYRYKIPLL